MYLCMYDVTLGQCRLLRRIAKCHFKYLRVAKKTFFSVKHVCTEIVFELLIVDSLVLNLFKKLS
jgi:hypothetical protein